MQVEEAIAYSNTTIKCLSAYRAHSATDNQVLDRFCILSNSSISSADVTALFVHNIKLGALQSINHLS